MRTFWYVVSKMNLNGLRDFLSTSRKRRTRRKYSMHRVDVQGDDFEAKLIRLHRLELAERNQPASTAIEHASSLQIPSTGIAHRSYSGNPLVTSQPVHHVLLACSDIPTRLGYCTALGRAVSAGQVFGNLACRMVDPATMEGQPGSTTPFHCR
jgi:hypothetical protein